MTLFPLPPASLRLRIDGAALAANWRLLDTLSGGAVAGAAVKANAYGLGVDHAVPVLRDAGAVDFFVAHWSEVPAVLRHIQPGQLSVLHGPNSAEAAQFARSLGVRPVINSVEQAQRWHESGGGPCDLMVDTGINRLGVPPALIGDEAIAKLEVETLLSHLASADDDTVQNDRQLALFREVAAMVPARRRSLANSAGIALGQRYAFDLTRPGLALYGGIARPELAQHIRQVAYPQAAVIQLRDISAGDSVGYNATFTAEANMRVATVSLGYADGFLRSWKERGWLGWRGTQLPILGRISMDLVVVDCTKVPDLREGDWLDLPYSLADAAVYSGLSQYELLTLLGARFARAGFSAG